VPQGQQVRISKNDVIISLLSRTALFGTLAADEIAVCARASRRCILPRVRCFSRNRQAPPAKRAPLDLGFSQGELVKMRGARPPKVNSALGELEGVGAIGRRLDRLSREPAKLAKIARQDDV
jgi:hypothetical protein